MLFSGITALTVVNRSAKGVNDGPCRYKRFEAFGLRVSGVSVVYATIPEKKAAYSQKSSTRVYFCRNKVERF